MKKSLHSCLLVIFILTDSCLACTNFCMHTPNGPVFGCNLDLFFPGDGLVFVNRHGIAKTGLSESATGVTAEWVSQYGSITFNLAGREWAFGGMNEAGLVVGSMELLPGRFPDKDEHPPLPIGPWAQYMLDMCATVDEVIAANKDVRIEDAAPPIHFLFADANGNCATIEWYEGQLVVHSGETLPENALTNSFYDTALGIYQKGGPHWWESDRGKTNKRFALAAQRNNAYASSGEPNAIKYAFETLTDVVAAPHTKWNIVYDIAKRQIFFRSAASPMLKYISMDNFDFDCSAPMLVLDINAPVKGSVEEHFQPYDHNANLTLLVNLCACYGIHLTPQDAEDLVSKLEGFGCGE